MPDKKISSLNYKEQKEIKPTIEEVIPECLSGDMKKTVLDFVMYLRANKMFLKWRSANSWKILHENKSVFSIGLATGKWVWAGRYSNFWFVALSINNITEYEESIIDAGLQKFIWDNIKYCNSCSKCAPGIEMTISGRELKNICRDLCLIAICDPDEETLNDIKKLLELEMKARIEKTTV